MIFSGSAIKVEKIDGDFAHMVLDLPGESVNKFNHQLTEELSGALAILEKSGDIKGLLISSAKDAFIVGADINEFGPVFQKGREAILEHLQKNSNNFNRLEDLPFPTVVAINGYALGGGLELCLACDFRVASNNAKVGLPETKLGLIPGWGGTFRLPRLVGLDTAIEWISGGLECEAAQAFKLGVIDGVVVPENLIRSSLDVLKRAAEGKLSFLARRDQKHAPLQHSDLESLLAFESSKMFVKSQAGRNYPAPVTAIKVMQEAAKVNRERALEIEANEFVSLAQTSTAKNLVSLFLNDQFVSKRAKYWDRQARKPVSRAAVLGAGIMGGGIAYQSAIKNVPIVMKDIRQEGLEQGIGEAIKLLNKRHERGRISAAQMAETINKIQPSLTYGGFEEVDLVIEAVVENAKVKKSVLAEVEKVISPESILCSNTSTISIDELASSLERPENFCGMHFFNPVHAMPLVEVIRGDKTSDEAIARTVAYANALGKKPIVVRNCPGFLVNRILFPYFAGFSLLIRDGADFQHVDNVMERWGWPMGPAYLLDVVGLDTVSHAQNVMSQGFPERMAKSFKAAPDILFEAGFLGQKGGEGFYRYEIDKKGKPVKLSSDSAYDLMQPYVAGKRDFTDEDIVARMMIPMATELAHCLEEGIVSSAAEADMALIYGLGFPPFRGGVFRWMDELGVKSFVDMARQYSDLGPLYAIPAGMNQMVADNKTYYPF